jgi:hypothetical protein
LEEGFFNFASIVLVSIRPAHLSRGIPRHLIRILHIESSLYSLVLKKLIGPFQSFFEIIFEENYLSHRHKVTKIIFYFLFQEKITYEYLEFNTKS